MELTAKDVEWQKRLITLAGQASDDDMPCVENVCLALIKILELPRHKQLAFANIVSSLVGLALD
jgi:hypothetical protein